MIKTLQMATLYSFILLFSSQSKAAGTPYDTTAIVNFFCEEVGQSLAQIAWKDKQNVVPMYKIMHSNPIALLHYVDNEIIRVVYKQSLTEDNAKRIGFRVCVSLMVVGQTQRDGNY